MELQQNRSQEELEASGRDVVLHLQHKATKLPLNSLSYVGYTLVFILFLQYYSKSVRNEGKGFSKKKSKCNSKKGDPAEECVYGLEAIPGPMPFLPTKLVGHFPLFLPYTGKKKVGKLCFSIQVVYVV